MKTKLLLMLLTYGLTIFAQCPIEGEGRNPKEKLLNSEKNRDCAIFSGDSIYTLNLDDILKGPDPTLPINAIIEVEGYIVLVKSGGSESCNCHAKDKSQYDVHIELGATPTSKGKQTMICEVTPRFPNRDKVNWKSYVGKKVKITGYVFYDVEHTQNAVNTNPKGTNLWRGTILEIHPVINIEKL